MSKVFKVLVVTNKEFTSYNSILSYCRHVLKNKKGIEIVSRSETKGDNVVEEFAIDNKLSLKSIPKTWDETYPLNKIKTLKSKREQQLIKYCDALVVFDKSNNSEIENLVSEFKNQTKPIKIYK